MAVIEVVGRTVVDWLKLLPDLDPKDVCGRMPEPTLLPKLLFDAFRELFRVCEEDEWKELLRAPTSEVPLMVGRDGATIPDRAGSPARSAKVFLFVSDS